MFLSDAVLPVDLGARRWQNDAILKTKTITIIYSNGSAHPKQVWDGLIFARLYSQKILSLFYLILYYWYSSKSKIVWT